VTEGSEPVGGSSPNSQMHPQAEAAMTPPGAPPVQADQPAAAAPAKGGRWRAILIIGGIVVFLGVVLFATRNNADADDLKVGDCINLPNGTTFKTVEKHPCTESHIAEVIYVGEYSGSTFPISLSLDSYIEDQCVPAYETYVGRAIDSDPELSVGYFHPTRDAWDGGERTITCYVTQPDESPMTESLKAV
jgi:Septum formation